MKKMNLSLIAVTMLMMLGLSAVQPKEANAAIGLDLLWETDGLVGFGTGIFGVLPIEITALFLHSGTVALVGAGLLVLDADGSLSQDRMVQALSAKYPFVDNHEVIEQLATAIKVNAPSKIENGKRYVVSVSQEEVNAILEGTDLTEDQMQKIADDLK